MVVVKPMAITSNIIIPNLPVIAIVLLCILIIINAYDIVYGQEYNISIIMGKDCFGIQECMEQYRYVKCPKNFDIFNLTEYYDCINGRNDTLLR